MTALECPACRSTDVSWPQLDDDGAPVVAGEEPQILHADGCPDVTKTGACRCCSRADPGPLNEYGVGACCTAVNTNPINPTVHSTVYEHEMDPRPEVDDAD